MCIHSDGWHPKTEERKAELDEYQEKKEARIADEQAEYDKLTPEEQAHQDLAKADAFDKAINKKVEGQRGAFGQKMKNSGSLMGNFMRAQMYAAGAVDGQGNPIKGLKRHGKGRPGMWGNPNDQGQTNHFGQPLRMTPFGPLGDQSRINTGGR